MYSLLVTASTGTWDQVPYEYEYTLDRFLEHTEQTLKARFGKLDKDAVSELCSIPTLFMYEQGIKGDGRFGYITSIQNQSNSIVFTYRFDPLLPSIDWEKLTPFLAELQIRTRAWEQTRTHWAVKQVDLLRVLKPILGSKAVALSTSSVPLNNADDNARTQIIQPVPDSVVTIGAELIGSSQSPFVNPPQAGSASPSAISGERLVQDRTSSVKHLHLVVPVAEARFFLSKQIREGESIFAANPKLFETRDGGEIGQVQMQLRRWSDFNKALLQRLFNADDIVREYDEQKASRRGPLSLLEKGGTPSIQIMAAEVLSALHTELEYLKSVYDRIPLYAQEGPFFLQPHQSQPFAVGGKNKTDEPEAQPFDVAIICALRMPELEKVLRTGQERWLRLRTEPSEPQTYHQSTYTTLAGTQLRVIAAAPNQMGPPASAALAAKMILRFKPRLVAMVGIAAGARVDPAGFGDVLAPDATLDYASGKIVDDGGKVSFKPDPKPIHVNSRLLSTLKEWQANGRELVDIWCNWQASKPQRPPSLIIGPLASGSSVVANRAVVDDVVLHWRKLIGLEMEAYAVHCACRDTVYPETPFLALKAVCDFADGSKNDEWQPYAAYVAAEMLYRFLAAEWENLHLNPHSPR